MIMQAYLSSSIIIFLYMSVGFVIAYLKKNNGIADIAWGIGFIIVTLFTFFNYGNSLLCQKISTLLVCIWGIRISGYLFLRNWGKKEDIRYAKMRAQWGKAIALRSFLQVFMLQGVILLIIIAPIIVINSSIYTTSLFPTILGITIWIIGLLCETIGDYQLYQFLHQANTSGQIMTQGLWKYTRHPNYFGEATMWWGIWLLSLSTPYGLITVVSPILLTFLLLYVSGVPLAEAPFKNNSAYQQYAQRTSSFFPWFTKDTQ